MDDVCRQREMMMRKPRKLHCIKYRKGPGMSFVSCVLLSNVMCEKSVYTTYEYMYIMYTYVYIYGLWLSCAHIF